MLALHAGSMALSSHRLLWCAVGRAGPEAARGMTGAAHHSGGGWCVLSPPRTLDCAQLFADCIALALLRGYTRKSPLQHTRTLSP